MKTLIIILIITSFLQTTIIPMDLILLILICRAFVKSDRSNLYLAFFFGLLASHLNLSYLGVQSLIYLVVIQITQMLSKSRLTSHLLWIVPISLVFLSLNQLINSFFTYQIFSLPKILFASVISLPILFLVRLWEERFIVRKEIKLKV